MLKSFNLIKSLQNIGGESTATSPLNIDLKVELEFVNGYLFNYSGLLEGKVNNNKFYSRNYCSPFCTNPNYTQEGIWNKTYETSVSRTFRNVREYFVPCTIDTSGVGWFVQAGLVCQNTGDDLVQDTSIFINADGTFKSNLLLSEGLKFLKLIRVTPDTHEVVHHLFGELPGGSIMRSYPDYLLRLNAKDQLTDLGEISLTLINLLQSDYKHNLEGRDTYYYKYEIDKDLQLIIRSNLTKILSLIDRTSNNNRSGSIPRYLATYSNYSNTYLNDSSREDSNLRIFEEDCFVQDVDPEVCSVFTLNNSDLVTSREVDNESVAWFLYLLTLYSDLVQEDFSSYISILTTYLINQIDARYYLPNQGWTSTPLLENSQVISTKLLRVATAYIAAFLKAHDVLNESIYLEVAWQVWLAIFNYFYNISSKKFYSSLTNKTDNEESLYYGILTSDLLNRKDISESLLSHFYSLVKVKYGLDISSFAIYNLKFVHIDEDLVTIDTLPVTFGGNLVPSNSIRVNNDWVTINEEFIYIGDGIEYETTSTPFLTRQSFIESPLEGFILTSASSSNPVFNDNTLTEDLIEKINNKYWVIARYNSYIVNRILNIVPRSIGLTSYLEYVESNEYLQSAYSNSLNLTEISQSRLISVPHELIYSNNLDFWTMLEAAISTLPKEYGWFSPKAINKNSIIGNILYSILIPVSSIFRSSLSLFTSKSHSLSSYYINNKLRDYGKVIPMYSSLEDRRALLSEEMKIQKSTTKIGITNLVESLVSTTPLIYEHYTDLFVTSSTAIKELNPRVGEGYFNGGDYGLNTFQVEIKRPVDSYLSKSLRDKKPAGSKIIIQQNLEFIEEDVQTSFNYSQIDKVEQYCVLALDDGHCFGFEDDSCVALYSCN